MAGSPPPIPLLWYGFIPNLALISRSIFMEVTHKGFTFLSKKPRPARRGFCKPRGNLSQLRYELLFLPALPSGVSGEIFVKEGCDRLVITVRDRAGAQRRLA